MRNAFAIRLRQRVAAIQGLEVILCGELARCSNELLEREAARLGRVSELEAEISLDTLASQIASALGCVPRVWGDPQTRVRTVAVATGSGGSLIGDARAAGAQVLVAGEVRYHDALDAMGSGLCIVEAGHDMTEWPLVEFLGTALRAMLTLPEDRIIIDTPHARWWTP